MNNITFVTVIGWEARSERRKSGAVFICKNYGLKPVLKNLYIGSLYEKERKTIHASLSKLFIAKTDKFFIGIMCQSCAVGLDSAARGKVRKFPSFELVEFLKTIDTKSKKAL